MSKPKVMTDDDYRKAVADLLTEKLGRKHIAWDIFEGPQVREDPVVEIFDSPDTQGAWVNVMVWIPAPK